MSNRSIPGVLIAATVAVAIAVLALADGSASSSSREASATPTTAVAVPADGRATSGTGPTSDSVPTVSEPPSDGNGTDEADGEETADDTDGRSPNRQPTVRDNDIAPASIVLALVVLGAVVLAWRIGTKRIGTSTEGSTTQAPTPASAGPLQDTSAIDVPDVSPAGDEAAAVDTATLGFLIELGEALVDAGDAVHNVTGTLEGVARVYGTDGLGAVVLPTALILSIPANGTQTTEVAIAGRSQLRLDQIETLMNVVVLAEQGELTPTEGRRRIRALRARPHPSSPALRTAGAAVGAAGLALVLRGGAKEVLIAATLGALVGLMTRATATASYLYRPFWPLTASFVVAAATFSALRFTDITAFPALVAPLITFLPGALLTIAVLELATGQILAGSARLASGVFQLVLLALGIVAGAQIVGVPASAVGSAPVGPIAVAGPWVGVAVFGIGIVWSQGLRTASIPAILVVLYVAYAGQVVGGVFVGSALSSFFGAVAMTPVAMLLARLRLGPPTLVAFFPGFWILVPGALGLEGVTRIIGDDRIAASDALTTALTSMVGIALGVLLGLALSTSDPERPWTAGSRLRRVSTRSS